MIKNSEEIKQLYKNDFDASAIDIKEESLFLTDFRKQSLEEFIAVPFPSAKDEEWRFTNVSPLLENKFTTAKENTANEDTSKIPHKGKIEVSITDANNFSISGDIETLPQGVVVDSIISASSKYPELFEKYFGKIASSENPFHSLNGAFLSQGLFIHIPKNTSVEHIINLNYINTQSGALFPLRNLFILEENSAVRIIAGYSGINEGSFSNIVSEAVLNQNAVLDFYKIQEENDSSFHLEKFQAVQKERSVLSHYNFTLGGSLVRNDINSRLEGSDAECNLWGIYLGKDKRIVDNHSIVDHSVPDCRSNELYKGILDDESRGIFNGKIFVRKDAQKTNAYQSNKTVLLSDKARINTKPQLEIFADDVKCSHGAAIGKLDKAGFFYLRSRGIPAELANSILIRAFASDVIEKIKIDELKEELNHKIFEHLHRTEI